MSQPFKIVFCADGIFPFMVGGMQRHSRLLIEALAKIPGNEIIVIHPHKGERIFSDFPNVTEHDLDPLPGRQYYLLELYLFSREVRSIILDHPDAIVYSQGLSVWSGVNQIGNKVIVNPHGLEPYQAPGMKDKLKTIALKKAFDYIFPRVSKVISLGGHLTDIIASVPKMKTENIVVIPNAANPSENSQEQLVKNFMGPTKFLFVGRFVSNKGISFLLEAVKQLNENGYSDAFTLNLAGKGPLFHEMQQKYCFPNVNFMGFVSDEDLITCYLKNHVFILPTLFEGMPTVIIEAMAHRMPIIVTNVGATLDMVSEENGFVLEKGSVGSIVNTMKQWMELPVIQKEEKSRASLRKCEERLTWEKVAASHMELFRSITNGQGIKIK